MHGYHVSGAMQGCGVVISLLLTSGCGGVLCIGQERSIIHIVHDVTMMMVCREALDNLDAALHDYKSVIIEQPNNKEAAQRVEELVKLTMETLPAEQNGP